MNDITSDLLLVEWNAIIAKSANDNAVAMTASSTDRACLRHEST